MRNKTSLFPSALKNILEMFEALGRRILGWTGNFSEGSPRPLGAGAFGALSIDAVVFDPNVQRVMSQEETVAQPTIIGARMPFISIGV